MTLLAIESATDMVGRRADPRRRALGRANPLRRPGPRRAARPGHRGGVRGLGVQGRRHRSDRRRHRPGPVHRSAGGGGDGQGTGPGPGAPGPRGEQSRRAGRGGRRRLPAGHARSGGLGGGCSPRRGVRRRLPLRSSCRAGHRGSRPAPGPTDPEEVRYDRLEPDPPQALAAWLRELAADVGRVRVVGDGAVRYRRLLSVLAGLDLSLADQLSAPPPLALARLARDRLARGVTPTAPADLLPDYRRPADARINWEQRTPRSRGPHGNEAHRTDP